MTCIILLKITILPVCKSRICPGNCRAVFIRCSITSACLPNFSSEYISLHFRGPKLPTCYITKKNYSVLFMKYKQDTSNSRQ